jgi:formamidopyrimidine-DNA glycosylase
MSQSKRVLASQTRRYIRERAGLKTRTLPRRHYKGEELGKAKSRARQGVPLREKRFVLRHIRRLGKGERDMPELPDITVYIEALETRILGQRLERVRIVSPFLLRTVEPAVEGVEGQTVVALRRLGKRICIGVEGEIWLVLHLMIAGRLHWFERASGKSVKLSGRQNLAAFEFSNGTLVWTEAGTQKRASLHLAAGEEGLRELDPGGVEVLECSLDEFAAVLRSENHTLKRTLTDARWFSGIGNAYSDEILWAAKLSPTTLTQRMSDEDVERLFGATRATLREWVERLRAETGQGFPEKVTAFRAEMAVHGKYKQPCPRCGSKIQRIKYASNETNYCAGCQTGGKLLADRAFSRLLREDWPRTLEELETQMRGKRALPPGHRVTER